MSLSKKEMAFIEKNIVLSEVDGEIVIELIRTDVQTVESNVGWVGKQVFRAESAVWVDGHVGWAASVGRVGDRENES